MDYPSNVTDALLQGIEVKAVRIADAPNLGILKVRKVASHKKFGTVVIVETMQTKWWPSDTMEFDAEDCIVVAY